MKLAFLNTKMKSSFTSRRFLNYRFFCSTNLNNPAPKKRFDLRQYGKVGIAIYLSTFVITLPTFYYLISRNYIDKKKLTSYIDSKGYDTQKYIIKFGENNVNFALAYLCLFCTKPLRVAFSCILAGIIINKKSKSVVDKSVNVNNVAAPQNKIGKLEKLKKFGVKGLIIYCITYSVNFLFFYFLIKNKYIDVQKFDNLIKDTRLEEWNNKVKQKVGEGSIILATSFFLNELFEVVRLPFIILLLSK
jgi:hypothetical protein